MSMARKSYSWLFQSSCRDNTLWDSTDYAESWMCIRFLSLGLAHVIQDSYCDRLLYPMISSLRVLRADTKCSLPGCSSLEVWISSNSLSIHLVRGYTNTIIRKGRLKFLQMPDKLEIYTSRQLIRQMPLSMDHWSWDVTLLPWAAITSLSVAMHPGQPPAWTKSNELSYEWIFKRPGQYLQGQTCEGFGWDELT